MKGWLVLGAFAWAVLVAVVVNQDGPTWIVVTGSFFAGSMFRASFAEEYQK